MHELKPIITSQTALLVQLYEYIMNNKRQKWSKTLTHTRKQHTNSSTASPTAGLMKTIEK